MQLSIISCTKFFLFIFQNKHLMFIISCSSVYRHFFPACFNLYNFHPFFIKPSAIFYFCIFYNLLHVNYIIHSPCCPYNRNSLQKFHIYFSASSVPCSFSGTLFSRSWLSLESFFSIRFFK